MSSFKQTLLQFYSRQRFGGQTAQVPVADRSVPTQTFNARAAGRPGSAAIVFLPGFASVPQLAAPGEVGAAARELGVDFVRFSHPDLLQNPSRLTYPRMIEEAVAVVEQLPQAQVVLTASSFGAGMMRFVADRVNRHQPGKVAGLFGFCAVTPEALTDLFTAQAGWRRFEDGNAHTLEVSSPTMNRPFSMSHQQADGVMALNGQPTAPFRGPALLVAGEMDPVGRSEFSGLLASQINPDRPARLDVVECGHVLPRGRIFHGVRALAVQSFR